LNPRESVSMAFQTTDVNFLDDWLTVGPLSRCQKASAAAPHTTQLLGNTVTLWCDLEGQVHASADGKELRVQVQYGYVWVCPSGQPARDLFSFPEYAEAGRRIVDCDGFGVAVSGLRMVENFLDMGHFPFVHGSYLGEVPHTEVAPYDGMQFLSTAHVRQCHHWHQCQVCLPCDAADVGHALQKLL
jgi:phenylpropionate dioxygenase-like ring-hydroxylating dioxygenase large terminal subunit